MNLYSSFAKDFSDTRQSKWEGWSKVLQIFKEKVLDKTKVKILDLGAGNGRFLKFLKEEGNFDFEYTGIDSSVELMNIARQAHSGSNINFEEGDLESESWDSLVGQEYDLILAFGLLHHLHTFEQRKKLFTKANNLLSAGGIFVVTCWQFKELPNFESKIIETLPTENDYILKFGNEAQRFCHFSGLEEIAKLEEGSNFESVDSFYSDGRTQKLNLYKIYTK